MRNLRVPALMAGLACLTAAAVLGTVGLRAGQASSQLLDAHLQATSEQASTQMTQTLERARIIDLMMAREPNFAEFVADPRPRAAKLADRSGSLAETHETLRYLSTIFPISLDSAGFATMDGAEVARFGNGRLALPGDLGSIGKQPFFLAAQQVGIGKVFRSVPYVSPVSGALVITNATETSTTDGKPGGVVYFSLTLDSFRTSFVNAATDGAQVRMIDGATGSVLLDSLYLQDASDEKSVRPEDRVFSSQLASFTSGTGLFTLDGQRMAVASVLGEDQAAGAGWVVVASSPAPGAASALGDFGWLVVLLVLLGVLLLGIALLLWIRTARERSAASGRTAVERDELASRMDDLSGALERVAGGDLAVSLPVEAFGSGGMARMVGSFDETIARLRVLVAQAQTSGDQLSGSASELLRLAAEQADMAGEQSAAVVETTVTIQQLAATATQIAESASGVSQAAGHMLALSEEGRVAVQDSLGAMDRIAGRVDSIASSTGSLSDRVNEIGGILALLDDLSDQTNLLALNAAIEAARAGEHGRGFAVVAAEIRKLAERARESTGRIQGLVAEIQANMNATLTASEDGAREVRGGSQLAHGAVDVLQRIAERVEDAAASVKEISVATQQQRTASDQVVVAMTRLAAVSQQYAAGSRQAAVSAEQLTALAEDLQGSIDTFSVVGDSADAGSSTTTEGSAVLLLAEPEVLDELEPELDTELELAEPEPVPEQPEPEQPDEGPEATI